MRDGYSKKDENTRTREIKVKLHCIPFIVTNHACIFPPFSSLEDGKSMPADDTSTNRKSSKAIGKANKKTDR